MLTAWKRSRLGIRRTDHLPLPGDSTKWLPLLTFSVFLRFDLCSTALLLLS